jgi:hypothetical protein
MNNSPYLDRPLLPLAVALPRLLEEVEAALARGTRRDAEAATASPIDPRAAQAAAPVTCPVVT